jgi:hypothetical protein
MKGLAVNVVAAFAVCALAVSLVVLLLPSVSWAAALEWLTTTLPCGGPGN